MIKMESDCLGCDWHTCVGCQYNGKSAHAYCDECGNEIGDQYAYGHIDGDDCLCEDCAREAGAFDEDGDLNEDEWEHYDVYQRAEDEREAAEDAYGDWLYECKRDEEMMDDYDDADYDDFDEGEWRMEESA